ncbi:MAG: hypothetical protein AB7G28_20080 [Pirellulales bacterium]
MSEADQRDEKFSREKFLGLLRSGLWPATALAYLGIGKNEWREMRQADASLAAEVSQAVAAFEMIHVRNLHAKIQEANDWRGSAWWLAQRFPNRYGTGRENKQVEKAVEEVLTVLDEALSSEFTAPAEVQRLATALAKVRLKRRS